MTIIFVIAGFFSIVVSVLKLLADFFPILSSVKAQFYMPIARKFQFKALEKSAIKADIAGNVNSVLAHLEKEMPSGWVKKLDILWVEQENAEDFLEDNEIVVRMRPLKNQNNNFVSALYCFVKSSFFPKTQHVIPSNITDSSVLHLSRRVIRTKKPHLENDFNESILEISVQKNDKILDYMDRYERIDSRGFFCGTFLREAHQIAQVSKLTPLRKHISSDIVGLLKHLENMTKRLQADEHLRVNDWSNEGKASSYKFLLVAHPSKSDQGTTDAYVSRVKDAHAEGIDRLYLYGSEEQKHFAMKVITDVTKSVPQYELHEVFGLHRDYRGDKGGIGALFVKKSA